MSHLPILVPGRSAPILVPCRLPDAFTFTAYLPSRGLRTFTAWLSSSDPCEAEIGEVTLGMPETDPRHVGGAYDLDEDEAKRADEAAGDVLTSLLARCGLGGVKREAFVVKHTCMHAIALAHAAECKAWAALRAAHVARHGTAINFYEANPATDEVAGGYWASKAANLLFSNVERALEEACAAQDAKAEAQQAERGGDEDAAGSERVSARGLAPDMVTP